MSETAQTAKNKTVTKVEDHIVEIVSDSGEGAQKAGQTFAAVSAKMGNGIWTVEIIPAEIQPPPRTVEGGSGNRIRLGSFLITNAGDAADSVIAFNEQVLLGRIRSGNVKKSAVLLLENKWKTHSDPSIVAAYQKGCEEITSAGYRLIEVPIESECKKLMPDPMRGKNMFALGVLCNLYKRDSSKVHKQIEYTFRKKSQKVMDLNVQLYESGYKWAEENLDFQFEVPPAPGDEPRVVMDGNTATGLGCMASGMEVCAMYPITPATSVSHYLSEVIHNVGGVVHQAEDEIAACGFAIGSSYAGKCAYTVTSGPGMALKTEFLGLAVMAEIPLVVVDVQRGGPSTGLPTKVEQADLLMSIFGTHGDAPKVVMAPSSIEDCFYSIITARKIAESFRMPVIVLTDANLATGQQLFPRPKFQKEWLAPPIDQSPVPAGKLPYAWDPKTGLSERFIPGRAGGMHTLTGLSHDENSKVAYRKEVHQAGCRARSLKLAAFQQTLKTPKVMGDPEGDLLIVCWGSTKGAIEEAIERVRKNGEKVSCLHLKYLQPMASGIKPILEKFRKVMTIEINYSDFKTEEIINEDNRRYGNLAWLLRARYLLDIDCWTVVPGQPLKPGEIEDVVRQELKQLKS